MNAIITAATGYSGDALAPFLLSVQRSCPASKLFLIVYQHDHLRLASVRAHFPCVQPIYVHRKFNRGGKVYRWIARYFIDEEYQRCGWVWRALGRYSLHMMLERFFIALEIIQAYRSSFTHVMLTDSRDVIVQRNPFEQLGDTLVSGLEESTIGDCPMNSAWIRNVYGTAIWQGMSDRTIICAGVTLGSASKVEQYLLAMCAEIWRRLQKVALIAQYDQGIHNYLIHTGQVITELTNNRDGVIATLHYEHPSNIQIDHRLGLVKVRGRAPAIVHQYDRHRDLLTFVTRELRS
jgi:hypothetical protein